MRKLLLLFPFVVVLAALAGGMRLLAFVAGQPYVPYNADLSGARVLQQREAVESQLPSGYDVLFAGTSRTMADFDAHAIGVTLTRRCGLARPLPSYNVGRVANSYGGFLAMLRRVELPKLLVLEFSPHVMLGDTSGNADPADAPEPIYQKYRRKLTVAQTLFSGEILGAFGLDEMMNLRPGQLVLIVRALERHKDHRLARLYYMLRSAQSIGMRATDSGQVLYRTYLPNRAAAELTGDMASEIRVYERVLSAPPDPHAWQSFTKVLALFGSDRQVVVVRPPVDPRLYALENEKQGPMVARVKAYLHAHGIAYIDLNGGGYYTTDRNHIDWYETARLSRDFARRLVPVIHPGLFAAGSVCAPP